jgi:hypothetical protein
MQALKSVFFPRKKRSPACMMSLDDPSHIHIGACFVDIAPLSIIELFQSQGCASCPPAIPVIHKAVMSNPNFLLLTYNVTYWDQSSGWKDTFGQTRWDQRHRMYAKRWGRVGVFTPQIVADGISDGIGAKEAEMMDVIGKAMEMKASQMVGMSISIDVVNGEELRITSDRMEAELHEVVIVRYDAMEHVVKIGKGPNKKKQLAHRNVVKDVMKIGEWTGGEGALRLPEHGIEKGIEMVVTVQAAMGGMIAAALKL